MKNVTITLDAQTAAWIRVFAAKRGSSVSRAVGDLLHEQMRATRAYSDAMRRFFAHKPFNFQWADGHPPAREEMHDRGSARDDLAQPEAK
jgi:hypothetical protein